MAMVLLPPNHSQWSNNSFKPSPLRGLVYAVSCTTPLGRYAGRLNSGVSMQIKLTRHSFFCFVFFLTACQSVSTKQVIDNPSKPDTGALDGDKDSIPDHLDQCPHSMPGETIAPDGCPAPSAHPTLLEASTLFFDTGSSSLSAESKALLRVVAEFLGRNPGRIELVGHSDSCGSPETNRILSTKRATVAHDYLLTTGLNPSLITRAYGVGSNEPADMRLPDGTCKSEINRRVEFREVR